MTDTLLQQARREACHKSDTELRAVIDALRAQLAKTTLAQDLAKDTASSTLVATAAELSARLWANLWEDMQTDADQERVAKAMPVAAHLLGCVCRLAYGIGRYLHEEGDHRLVCASLSRASGPKNE